MRSGSSEGSFPLVKSFLENSPRKCLCLTHLLGHVVRRAPEGPATDSRPHLYDSAGSQLSADVSRDRSEQHALLSRISEKLRILDHLAACSWAQKHGFFCILKPRVLGGPGLSKLACVSKQAQCLHSFVLTWESKMSSPPTCHFGPTVTEAVRDWTQRLQNSYVVSRGESV